MPRGSRSVAGVAIASLIAIHFLLRPLLVQWPLAPDFLLGGLLLAALRLRPGVAACLGFALGILEASLVLQGFGRMTLALTLLGYFGARSRDWLFSDSPHFVFIYLFLGAGVGELAAFGLPGRIANGLVALAALLGRALLTSLVIGAAAKLTRADEG